eukprot:3236330-Pyramimonas_sp.AAC.1
MATSKCTSASSEDRVDQGHWGSFGMRTSPVQGVGVGARAGRAATEAVHRDLIQDVRRIATP